MRRKLSVLRAAWLLPVAVAFSACDDEQTAARNGGEQDSSATAAESGEGARVWSFRVPPGEAGASIGAPMPADPEVTALVPATNLFPGGTAVIPNIQNPYSGDQQAIAAGERHFAAFNCSGCHAPLGGGGMGPPLSDDKWIYGDDPAQIFLSIVHGRPDGMPAWGAMLPQKTVWELVAYIETLPGIENPAQRLNFEDNQGRFRESAETAQGDDDPADD